MSDPYVKIFIQREFSVLESLVDPFVARNYHVLLYNSRGVGESTGSASWNGLVEAEDLKKVVIKTVHMIDVTHKVGEVILVGYSYGSLQVSMHPATIQISPTDTIRASHILLSYPLSVIGLLTLFNTSTYKAGLKTLVSNEDSKVLLLWGDADQFTGRGKYESWASEMTKDGGGKVKAVKVHGADHFWRGALGRRMVRAIEEWI